MSIFKIKKEEEVEEAEPAYMTDPKTVGDYSTRAWAYYARQELELAEADFREALSMDTKDVEANYGLGVILKAQVRAADAVGAFKKTLELLDKGEEEDRARVTMLRQMIKTHIEDLT